MTTKKYGISEQARQAEANQDFDLRAALIKKINSKTYRFASEKTKRRVKRSLGVIS